jgi:hypothetical protein
VIFGGVGVGDDESNEVGEVGNNNVGVVSNVASLSWPFDCDKVVRGFRGGEPSCEPVLRLCGLEFEVPELESESVSDPESLLDAASDGNEICQCKPDQNNRTKKNRKLI